VLANLEMSWLAPSKLRRTVVVGSEKMIVYEDGSPEPIRVFDHGVVYRDPETFGEYHLSYRTGDVVSPKIDGTEPLALEMNDFAQAIRHGRPPQCDIALALDVVRMIEAAEASLRDNGATVAVGGPQMVA
jgi:predicted dehydrogenase